MKIDRKMTAESLKVLLLSPVFAEYSVRLGEALAKKAKVLLILDRYSSSIECLPTSLSRLRGMKVRTYGLTGRRRLLEIIPMLLKAVSFKPDIVHIQEHSRIWIYLLANILGSTAKIVITAHDPVPHFGSEPRPLKVLIVKRIRSSADLLLAHGRYCSDLLSAEVKNKVPVKETRHGVLLLPLPDQIRKPIARRILCFGQMEAYKGLRVLLSATELLAARGVQFSLHLAGKGSELDRLRTSFERLPNVVIRGEFLAPPAAIAEFQEADIVVLPYVEASQSGVLAAAFGNSRPVVASRVGGLTDVVTHGVNGLLVKPNDPEALADALQAALESPSLLATLRHGAEGTARKFMNWDQIADETIQYYWDLTEIGSVGQCRQSDTF